jgi:Domain of unknown function (DUF4833)
MSAPSLPVHCLLAVGLSLVIAASFASGTARAARLTGPLDALTITKSSNRNEVQYSVQVDDACAPTGNAPVRPYWRMLELGPVATAPLTDAELNVLGVDSQEVYGNRVQLTLKGFPGRKIAIETQRDAGGGCASSVQMTIAGVPAVVTEVYVRQRLFGLVDYVLLTGRSRDGGLVSERISP